MNSGAPRERRADVHPRGARYFAERAIDPERAAQREVQEAGGALVYTITTADGQTTFERRRALNGGPAKVRQPNGQPLVGWWPAGRPGSGGIVLVTEGEFDALAALSALPHGRKVPAWPTCRHRDPRHRLPCREAR